MVGRVSNAQDGARIVIEGTTDGRVSTYESGKEPKELNVIRLGPRKLRLGAYSGLVK